MSDLRLRAYWFAAGFSLLLLVALLSLMPVSDSVVSVVVGNDKLAHIVIYALLSGWFSLLVIWRRSLWWVWCGLMTYGLLIEFLQGLTDYRFAELNDAIANSIGAALGLICHFTRLRDWLRQLDRYLSNFW